MVNFTDATALALAPELASDVMRLLPRELQDAFMQAPDVFMLFASMGLAAVLVAAFWMLNGMGRAERAFLEGVAAERDGIVNWGELADLTGFSDQSHLCRQTRRVTGFTPAELRRRLAEDEGFWIYRLWGLSELHLRAD